MGCGSLQSIAKDRCDSCLTAGETCPPDTRTCPSVASGLDVELGPGGAWGGSGTRDSRDVASSPQA